jgi:uridine phosphorylase
MISVDTAEKPHHLTCSARDLLGNGGRGRYIIMPGSDGRAEQIAAQLTDGFVRPSPRRHTYYAGRLAGQRGAIDVAVVASGMGCPSVDIIVHELLALGARRILRIGTAGSLQPQRVPAGALVIATSAVRDEGTSRHYLPLEVPAVAAPEFIDAALRATAALACGARVHLGIVHSKDALYARELSAGPLAQQHRDYLDALRAAGALASEMEASQLFIRAMLADTALRNRGDRYGVQAGAVLAVIGGEQAFADEALIARTTDAAIALGLETIRQHDALERD